MPAKTKTDLPYRRCVGIMLVNEEGKVWIGDRIGATNPEGLKTWQMPQGGIDKGENPDDAARRELLEETGTDKAEIVAVSEHWYSYDLPTSLRGRALKGKFRGQTQRWFLMRFTGKDSDIDITADAHQEFSEWKWVDISELTELIVDFKRPVYEKVVAEFTDKVAAASA
jgi:putative (di)nucleoside polyphosphate hydrolase